MQNTPREKGPAEVLTLRSKRPLIREQSMASMRYSEPLLRNAAIRVWPSRLRKAATKLAVMHARQPSRQRRCNWTGAQRLLTELASPSRNFGRFATSDFAAFSSSVTSAPIRLLRINTHTFCVRTCASIHGLVVKIQRGNVRVHVRSQRRIGVTKHLVQCYRAPGITDRRRLSLSCAKPSLSGRDE